MFDEYNKENTPWFSLNGNISECKVIDVYDADTVTIIIPYNSKMYKIKCRLHGIDSAEIRTKNKEEKKIALESKEWVASIIKDKVIWIKCGKWGKYGGRMLGTLYLTEEDLNNNKSFNSKIIEKGYAYKYDGKKRKRLFEDWFRKTY